MKCAICGSKCDGKIMIDDIKEGNDYIVCSECYHQYIKHEFDVLTDKLMCNTEWSLLNGW